MDVEELPDVNAEEIIDEMPSASSQTVLPPTEDMATDMAPEQMPPDGDGVAVPKQEYLLYTPSATSSKSKSNNVNNEIKTEIKEFFRIIRPHLPRKSKSKAYKLLQNIANGTVFKSSFQQKIKKKKPKKRPMRKQRSRKLKTKSLSIVRRNARSLYGSSDSCRSNTSCPHCGYSCSKIGRC